jgi:hypothetical protein
MQKFLRPVFICVRFGFQLRYAGSSLKGRLLYRRLLILIYVCRAKTRPQKTQEARDPD